MTGAERRDVVTIHSAPGKGYGGAPGEMHGPEPEPLTFDETVAHLAMLKGKRIQHYVEAQDQQSVLPIWVIIPGAAPEGEPPPDVLESLRDGGSTLLEFFVAPGPAAAGFPIDFEGFELDPETFAGAYAWDDGEVAVNLTNGARFHFEPVQDNG